MRDAQRRFADGLQLTDDARQIARKSVEFLPTTRNIHSATLRQPSNSPPYSFVFIGRWHRNKGIDLLLNAIAMLDEEDWMLVREFRVFGGGPLEVTVRQKCEALSKAGRPVVLGGYVNKHQAEIAISNADYVLIPSRVESIPVIFSDAMKLHRPVVATPVGDFCRLFQDSPFGILAAAASPSGICDAIKKALRTCGSEFTQGLNLHAQRFDLKKIAARICETAAQHE